MCFFQSIEDTNNKIYLLVNRKKFLLLFLHLLLELIKEDGTPTKQTVLSGGVDLQLMES